MTFKIHGLEMGGKVTSWEGVRVCDEHMKDTVSECVRKCENECVNECERGCGLENEKWTSKLEVGGVICNKNDIIRAMHSLWSYNIFCLGRSVMDKFVVRTQRVAIGATEEVS